jgi:hypothetical protein
LDSKKKRQQKLNANSGTVSCKEIGDLFCEIYVQRLTVFSEVARELREKVLFQNWEKNSCCGSK